MDRSIIEYLAGHGLVWPTSTLQIKRGIINWQNTRYLNNRAYLALIRQVFSNVKEEKLIQRQGEINAQKLVSD